MLAGRLRSGALGGFATAAIAFALPAAALAGDGTFTASPDGPLPVGSTPNAIGIGDFNQDGDPDMAVINRDSSDLNVLIGATGATFTTSPPIPLPPGTQAGGGPADIAVGDFNGDADPDLVVSNPTATPSSITVFTGGGGTNFTSASIPINQRPTEIAIGDFNGDADPDLAVVTFSNNRVAILTGGAGSTFAVDSIATFAGDSPSAIAASDFNADGDPDLAVTSLLLTKVTVLLGANAATFTPQTDTPTTGELPSDIVAADFNGDNDPDLAVANSQSDNLTLFSGQSGPGFSAGETIAAGDGPSAITSGSFNGDADPDLAVANQTQGAAAASVSVLLGGSGAAFAAAGGSPVAVGAEPLAVAAADFNGDGNVDLASADGGADGVTLLLGNAANTPPPPGGADRTPPQTTIDRSPPATTEKSKAKIAYSANEAATFECKLKGKGVDPDLRAFSDCGAAKIKYKHLDPGKKKFQVRAIDAAGNIDPSPAKIKWKVLG